MTDSLRTYARFKFRDLLICQGVCLGDDGNEVNFGVKLLHELDINGLQASERVNGGKFDVRHQLTSDPSVG